MFQTAPGVTIPFPEKITQEYQIYERKYIYANVSFEKLQLLVSDFYKSLPEPLFFMLQLPLSLNKIKELGLDETELYQEVLYLDGQTQSQIDSIMASYGELLLRDGMSQFAIASHQSGDEIFLQKYKLVSIYSQTPENYISLLKRHGLRQTDRLVTVWDTFSPEHPGECNRINIDGLDALDVAEILKKQGMYHAKTMQG